MRAKQTLIMGGVILALLAGIAMLLRGEGAATTWEPKAAAAPASQTGEQMTWDDVHELAVAYDAVFYGLVCSEGAMTLLDGEVMAVTEVERSDGSKVPPGRVLDSEEIKSGVVLTREIFDVWVGEDYWREVQNRELLVVGPVVVEYDDYCANGICCSVTCRPGYYACCSHNLQPPPCGKCGCVQDGQPSPEVCHSGGPGAISCSIGQ